MSRARERTRLVRGVATATALALVAALGVEGAGGCGSSTCPYPRSSAATIDPPQSCLDAKVSSCLHATLSVKNLCSQPLYLSTDYGVFSNASPGQEVEVLPGSSITYEVREDKATSKTSDREDYAIPGRVGPQALTFTFFIEKG